MKLKKRMMFFMSLVLLAFSFSNVYAHSTSQEGVLAKTYHSGNGGYYIGGEDVGWSIDESCHTNGTTITYSFSTTDSALTNSYKTYTIEGASKWNDVVNIINKTDGTGTGEISTIYDANTAMVAKFTIPTTNGTDANGHLKEWSIVMNRAYNITSITMAHEFGHVIGLNDLYESKNRDKIMYGYSLSKASEPTSLDEWGAKVITGVHSSHNWRYEFYDITNTGNRHIRYCTSCNGTGLLSKCIYNSNKLCRFCGAPQAGNPL